MFRPCERAVDTGAAAAATSSRALEVAILRIVSARKAETAERNRFENERPRGKPRGIWDRSDFMNAARGGEWDPQRFKKGVPAISLPNERVMAIRAVIATVPGAELTIDLPAQTLRLPDGSVERFEVDPFRKECRIRQRHSTARKSAATSGSCVMRDQRRKRLFSPRHVHPCVYSHRATG